MRNQKWTLVFVLLSVVAVGFIACNDKSPRKIFKAGVEVLATQAGPKVVIEEGKLTNGLKVLLMEDHSAPVVTVQVWYRVGSRNEHRGIRGLAHLMEHMMFKGSQNVAPQGHAQVIASLGGTMNAFTTEDITAYFNTVPVEHMSLVMELEAERMGRLRLDETNFFKEREVVKEEIRMRLQNDPMGALRDKLQSVAFTVHPYNWTAGGNLVDLDLITLADMQAFYRAHYIPNNAVLVVVGDTRFAEVMKLAHQHFGSFAARKRAVPVMAREPEQDARRFEQLKMQTELPTIIGGFKVPEAAHADMAALDVVESILGEGRSSRLNRALVRDQKLAIYAVARRSPMLDPGLFMLVAGFLPSTSPEQVEKALLAEVQRLGQEGPSEAELQKAKNQLSSSYLFQLTSIQYLGFRIGFSETVEKDYRHFVESYHAYDNISAADVKRVASTYLIPERLTMVLLTPPKAGEQVQKAAATTVAKAAREPKTWPTAPRFLDPPMVAAEAVELPPIARRTLTNGLDVLVVERHEHPVVYFDLIVPGGDLLDPAGKAGLGGMLGAMMNRGAGARNAEQLAEIIDGLGGALHASSTGKYFEIFGSFLSKDFQQGLALTADVSLRPRFASEELAKLRPQLEGGLRHAKNDPESIGREHLNYLIYGYGHAKGRPASLATVQAVSLDDIKRHYARVFIPQGSILVITGDVDPVQIMPMLEKVMGAWTPGKARTRWPPDPKPFAGRPVRLIDKPDLTQSTICLGQLGLAKSHADRIPMLLGNFVLGGGGFSSRLMQKVRSRSGKTYSVRSGFSTGKTKGKFSVFSFTRNSETANTVRMIQDEIDKTVQEGITEKELNQAKNYYAGTFTLALQSPGSLGDQVLMAEFYGLGLTWLKNFKKVVMAPTLDQVNRALKKHLNTKRMALVVVGKAEEIAKQMAQYGKPTRIDYRAPVTDQERKRAAAAKKVAKDE